MEGTLILAYGVAAWSRMVLIQVGLDITNPFKFRLGALERTLEKFASSLVTPFLFYFKLYACKNQ